MAVSAAAWNAMSFSDRENLLFKIGTRKPPKSVDGNTITAIDLELWPDKDFSKLPEWLRNILLTS